MSTDSKTAIVTGGAGRLGLAFCKALAQDQWKVYLADIDYVAAKNASNRLSELGLEVIPAELDITNSNSIQKLLNQERFNLLVNNAYPRNKNFNRSFFEVEYNDLCENINSHLGGYFLMSQLFSKHLLDGSGGSIINISSIYGVIAPRFEIYDGTKLTTGPEYPLIKSSVIHLTKYMAQLLKGHNIRVNCISPGGVLDQQPKSFVNAYDSYCNSKGMLQADDISAAVTFLASNNASAITGQNLIVDDGFTL